MKKACRVITRLSNTGDRCANEGHGCVEMVVVVMVVVKSEGERERERERRSQVKLITQSIDIVHLYVCVKRGAMLT